MIVAVNLDDKWIAKKNSFFLSDIAYCLGGHGDGGGEEDGKKDA